MANQIPYNHQIWELTPTELKIAYLSMSMSKKEIATHLVTKESTVGTHLTNIFTKLGITGVPDEEKRPLLKEKFGSVIERLVVEVGGDYEVEYRERRREALEKREEFRRPTQRVEIPDDQSGMSETPPEPVIRLPLTRQVLRERDLLMLGIGFIAGMILFGLLFRANERPAANVPNPTTAPANAAPQARPTSTRALASRTPTAEVTPTQEVSPTPEPTLSPTISPTAIPLPIKENFDTEYDALWQVFGDPVLTRGVCYGCDSVFTTRQGAVAGLAIGNTAWTNYAIRTRIARKSTNGAWELSVRMIDLNNRVILSCASRCSWVVIYQGERDVLDTQYALYDPHRGVSITVQGNIISVLLESGNPGTQLILPDQYKDKFTGGGIMLEITEMEVDYLEIHPLP